MSVPKASAASSIPVCELEELLYSVVTDALIQYHDIILYVEEFIAKSPVPLLHTNIPEAIFRHARSILKERVVEKVLERLPVHKPGGMEK